MPILRGSGRIRQDDLPEFAFVDSLLLVARPYVGIFVVEDVERVRTLFGVGSGFLVCDRDNFFLVTAGHVFEELSKYDDDVVKIFCVDQGENGRISFSIGGLKFLHDLENDIAVAFLPPKWLESRGAADLVVLSVSREDREVSEDRAIVYGVLGFPGVHNVYRNLNVVDTLQGISLWDGASVPRESSISKAIAFRFGPKDARKSNGTSVQAKRLHLEGMSGGPILQFFVPLGKAEVRVRVFGVFAEWHADKPCIVGASTEALFELIDFWQDVLRIELG